MHNPALTSSSPQPHVLMADARCDCHCPPPCRTQGQQDLFVPQHSTVAPLSSHATLQHLSVAPSDTSLIVSTSGNELLQLDLGQFADAALAADVPLAASSGTEMEQEVRSPSRMGSVDLAEGGSLFRPLSNQFHAGRVLGMDMCAHQQLLATVAEERSLRWAGAGALLFAPTDAQDKCWPTSHLLQLPGCKKAGTDHSEPGPRRSAPPLPRQPLLVLSLRPAAPSWRPAAA